MTERNLLEALSDVDEHYVEHAATALEGRAKRRKPHRRWQRIALLAACFAVMLGAMIPIAYRTGSHGTTTSPEPVDPTQNCEEIFLTADDIADFFGSKNVEGPTNQYGTTYTPDSEYLDLIPLSDSEYFPIYELDLSGKKANRKEFTNFVEQYLPPLADAVDLPVPAYEIEASDRPDNVYFDLYFDLGLDSADGTHFSVSQTSLQHRIGIYCYSSARKGIHLDGEQVAVDQTLSDEEIIASLAGIREKLCAIFGESFTDAKVERYYDGYSEYGVTFLQVYFYNEADHPLNAVCSTPYSNYISLDFDNFANFHGDIVSKDRLINVDIDYVQVRTEMCKTVAKSKAISLQTAENLLSQGYCFGGHSCPLCMAEQKAIDFSDYDFVTLRYVFEEAPYLYDDDVPLKGIPFYVFYKYIDKSENGNLIYAYTYVPAIELSGLEEYFQSQTQNHTG